jgi:hypothetical protein
MGDTPKYSEGQRFKVLINGKEKFNAKFSNRMMSQEDKDWVIYAGSSLHSLPELGTVRDLAGYKEVDIKIGDKIEWYPINENT